MVVAMAVEPVAVTSVALLVVMVAALVDALVAAALAVVVVAVVERGYPRVQSRTIWLYLL